MTKKIVVGSDQKPNSDQLLEMYEKLDAQTKEIKGQMKRGVLNPRHIQALIEHRNPFPKKEEAATGGAGNSFRVSVNYDLRMDAAVQAGKYNWVNDNITEKNFPTERKGAVELEIVLVHLDRAVSSEEAIREMDKMGLRPAELPELLAFGAKYPDEQRKYPIVALGSVWQRWLGGRDVPYLWHDSSGRRLDLHWVDGGWSADYRFAGVRK